MKLTTQPGTLAAAVKFAARALTARAAYPILGGLKITAADGGAEVAAFDYETSARARIDADVGEPGTVLTPGRLLTGIAAQLPRQPVELASDGAALTVTAGRTRYTLRLLPADDYPALPELAAPAGQADAAEFAAAVRQVVVAASRDDTLPALCAIQVTFTADAIIMVATDRYRAALRELPWQPSGDQLPPPVLIPAPALADVARDTGDDPVRVHVLTGTDGAPAVAGFTSGARTITTRLSAGEYPNMARMIPAGFAATAVLDTGELAEAVKRLAVVAARDTPVHLAFGPGQVELTAGSADEADGADAVGCELDGDPLTVAFHPSRLLDALTAVGSGRARVALTGPGKAALFTPASDDEGQGDGAEPVCRHLLMPIRTAG
jgi:DNA polymerase III subunit beta